MQKGGWRVLALSRSCAKKRSRNVSLDGGGLLGQGLLERWVLFCQEHICTLSTREGETDDARGRCERSGSRHKQQLEELFLVTGGRQA